VIPATLKAGSYRLVGGLYRPSDGQRLKVLRGRSRGDDQVSLTTVSVEERPHDFTPPSPAYATYARFGELAILVGYDLQMRGPSGLVRLPGKEGIIAHPGEELHLTLYWNPIGTTSKSYAVFVHLTDEQGNVWAYGDALPAQGERLTTSWVPGEYIADEHLITLPSDIPQGCYTIAIGLYEPPEGPRLPLLDEKGESSGDTLFLIEAPVLVR